MKQILLAIMLLFTATAVSAQQKNEDDFSKRLYEVRLAEVSLRLNLSDKQKADFAPIYEQYCKEMGQLLGKPLDGRRYGRPGKRAGGKGMRQGGPGARPEGGKMRPDVAGGKSKGEGAEAGKERMSDADKVKHMKARMEKQKKAQDIRLSYADKFAAVLTDKQLVRFYEVEDDMMERLRSRAAHTRGKR